MNQSKETDKFIIALIEDDLVRIDVKPNTVVEKKDIEENYIIYNEFLNGRPALFLVVFGEGVTASDEARLELANFKRDKIKIAEAGVVPSLVTRIMAQFFMAFFKPPRPIKMFTDEEAALKWLLQYRDGNKK
ncbi:MAG: hypothetical protein HRT72_10325 [Flavobacteriales bacterium]|nr:hypothetical protein [Flavobacteriales bacterium]